MGKFKENIWYGCRSSWLSQFETVRGTKPQWAELKDIFRVKYITVKKNQDVVKKIEKTRSADVTPDLQAERLERDRRVIEEDKKVARKKADEEHKLKLVNIFKFYIQKRRRYFWLPKNYNENEPQLKTLDLGAFLKNVRTPERNNRSFSGRVLVKIYPHDESKFFLRDFRALRNNSRNF